MEDGISAWCPFVREERCNNFLPTVRKPRTAERPPLGVLNGRVAQLAACTMWRPLRRLTPSFGRSTPNGTAGLCVRMSLRLELTVTSASSKPSCSACSSGISYSKTVFTRSQCPLFAMWPVGQQCRCTTHLWDAHGFP